MVKATLRSRITSLRVSGWVVAYCAYLSQSTNDPVTLFGGDPQRPRRSRSVNACLRELSRSGGADVETRINPAAESTGVGVGVSIAPATHSQAVCAGRSGLFGQHDHFEESRYLHWPEAEQLKDMAREIHSIREDFGESNPQVERFLHYCSLRGPNVPGEPKLAQSLLDATDTSGPMRPQ
jgi:hypothetical protein